MKSSLVYGKGMAFPPRVGADGRIAWSDGEGNVREAMRVILMTAPGERLRLPEFGAGLGRFLFEPNTLSTHTQMRQVIADALKRWEPRIQVEDVDVQADSIDPQAAIATITFRLVATQALERVALAVSVANGR
jgi:phage baseplate assembly protein W